MESNEIRKVLIIGTGFMGQQIGLQSAIHGFDVTFYDISAEALETAMKQVKSYTDQLTSQNRVSKKEAEIILKRIATTTEAKKAAENADIISESVPEDPSLKEKVFSQFNELCPAKTIFTTNTSTLVPSMFAKSTGRPDKLISLHFHPLVWDSNVVDVMPHEGTSKETIETVMSFAKKIGQIPIFLNKESHEYVFNAMLSTWLNSAMRLASNGIASVEDIDRAWMGITKMNIGPFGILDLVGIKTAHDISSYWAKKLGDPKRQADADFLKSYLDKGFEGIKNGKGFYSYPNPAYQQKSFLAAGKE